MPDQEEQPIPPPGTVLVNKDSLDKLIKRVEDQEERIGLLTEASDKTRMDLVQRRHQKPLAKIVHVHRYQGKYVLSTAMGLNEAYHDPLGKYVEKQELEVSFAPDKTGKAEVIKNVPYNHYMMNFEKEPAEIISSTTDSTGKQILVVKVKATGETLTIDSRFVN